MPPPSSRSRQRFLCGERFTEADLRLFPTIARFDAVYATLFKCCRRCVRADYPHLQARRPLWGCSSVTGSSCGQALQGGINEPASICLRRLRC